MATDLTRIGAKARGEPKLVFTSLYHHVTNIDNLRACYDSLKPNKATGVDKVTKEEYGRNLEANLKDLSARLRRMGYRPAPKRRTYIPKPGSEKGRPLGISILEDKIVETAVKRMLEPIYEADFENSSYGYRPGSNQHKCLDALGKTIQQKRIAYIVEADIRGFFDNVNHEWLIKFLRHRIGDERVIRLIARMLKSGIMEDGMIHASESGTPQGAIVSPLLSNIYLHYVLDLWFARKVSRQCRGEAHYFRFADDFVACFEHADEANMFYRRLGDRLEGFNLSLAEEKTRVFPFGRYARDNARKRDRKPAEFTFLGFTHYCGKTRNGYFKVKRRTSRKKLGQSLRQFTEWAESSRRYMRKGEMIKAAARKINGHLGYYAITDNSDRCRYYVYQATQILFKWLNRKSQKTTYTWPQFRQVLKFYKWPTSRIRKDLTPCRRTEAF
jgi:RNA-directed DNA polymerase